MVTWDLYQGLIRCAGENVFAHCCRWDLRQSQPLLNFYDYFAWWRLNVHHNHVMRLFKLRKLIRQDRLGRKMAMTIF